MNIFAIDRDPVLSARHSVDLHTVKMVLESAQMLANCFTPEQLASSECPRTKTGTVRRYCHFNHPCSKWVRLSKDNMRWLIAHALELDVERMARFKSSTPHFAVSFIYWVQDNINLSTTPDGKLTEFAQAMPEEYKCEDSVEAYKNLYKYGKVHLHSWKRNKPDWLV
jgi:hypothetical protein